MNSGFASRRKQVESTLLDYHRTPGKYPLLLRRPEILFSSIKEVLLLASGRMPDGALAPGLAVQRAAGFFVRTALLYPAADHYALLGLDRSADAAAIKERYRQMMRLMHPDFASSAAADGNWPADAASRINQAYEVLASETQRRSYDEKLNPANAPGPNRAASAHSLAHVRAAAAPAPDPRLLLKRMASAFGILAALALAMSLLARGPDGESLVQREVPRTSVTAVPPSNASAAATVAMQQAPSVEAPASIENPPVLREALAPRHEAPKVEPLMQPALPAHLAIQLPVAVEAPPVGRAGTAPAALRTAALAPMQPAPGRIIGVSIDTPAAAAMPAPPPPATTHVQAPAPLPPAPAPVTPPATTASKAIVPAVTMVQAHNLLSALLQQMESGSGDRLLSALDRSTRNAPAAQALARQYNSLVEGARSVKISNVSFKADPREDRLLVRGHVLLEIGDDSAMRAKELSLEVEFAKRNGAIVMTRLAPAPAIGSAAQ